MLEITQVIQDPDLTNPNKKIVHARCNICGNTVLASIHRNQTNLNGRKCPKCKN